MLGGTSAPLMINAGPILRNLPSSGVFSMEQDPDLLHLADNRSMSEKVFTWVIHQVVPSEPAQARRAWARERSGEAISFSQWVREPQATLVGRRGRARLLGDESGHPTGQDDE